jgi:hypothetical protein
MKGPGRVLKVKPSKYFDYVMAWFKYFGAIFTTAGDIGNTVRDSFSNIHFPKKNDFV